MHTSDTKFNRNLSNRQVKPSFCLFFRTLYKKRIKYIGFYTPFVKTRDKNIPHTCNNVECVKVISITHQAEMFKQCAGKVKFVFIKTCANVTMATITNSHKIRPDTQLYMRYVTGAASIKIIKPLSFVIKFPSLALYYPC
jgi:hypothetical protein